jgi:hypothetical protein
MIDHSSSDFFVISVWNGDCPPDEGGWIDYHDLKLVARTLRSSEALDREFWRGLADKLDPSNPRKSRYKLIRVAGRPQIKFRGPLVASLDKGDLKSIAEHLRGTFWPDQRVVDWLVDRLDPPLANSPRLVVKLPVGRPVHKSFAEELQERIIAAQVESEFRAHGKLDAALRSVEIKTGISRTTALRRWKRYYS